MSVSRFLRATACGVSLALVLGAFTRPAMATTLITTEQLAQEVAPSAQSVAGDAHRQRLAGELDRPELQARLEQWGVSAELARQRIAALSDQEAAELVAKIDDAPAGGDVLGVILFVFVLLLITDILGFTKVFPFTRSIR
ncbi:MAG TPA: PA2779 family protein [Burkholderiaceae bacterium]|nr:PA2779 family protein [Burkholderiaceae bacterium]